MLGGYVLYSNVPMGCTYMYNQLISTYFSEPIWTLYMNFIAKEDKLYRGHVNLPVKHEELRGTYFLSKV